MNTKLVDRSNSEVPWLKNIEEPGEKLNGVGTLINIKTDFFSKDNKVK